MGEYAGSGRGPANAPEPEALDLLIEASAVSGLLASGVNPQVLAQRSTLGEKGVNVLAQQHYGRRIKRAAVWTAAEDEFLRNYLGHLSVSEIAHALGRSVPAVTIRWKRELHLPPPSKDPRIYTAGQIGDLLGKDRSVPADWMDRGVLPGGYDLPLEGGRRIRVIARTRFLMWALNPHNWIYFDPQAVRAPYLKRLLARRAERWGDEWWTPAQVAAYHGVGKIHIGLKAQKGVLESVRRWGNHRVLKSVAVQAHFFAGKGGARMRVYSKAADAFLVLARAVGLTTNAIAALLTRHYGFERRKIRTRQTPSGPLDPFVPEYRLEQLCRDAQALHGLCAAYRLRVLTGAGPGDLFADWKHYRARFPALARAMDKFRALLQGDPRPLTLAERRMVRGVLVRWAQHFLGHAGFETRRRRKTGALSNLTLVRFYHALVTRGVDPFKEGYMNISTRTETIFTLELTQAQAEAVVKDPATLQRELRAALHTIGSTGGTPKKQRKPQKKVPCPECARPIAPHWLERHRETKHGVAVTKSTAKKNGSLQHVPVTA